MNFQEALKENAREESRRFLLLSSGWFPVLILSFWVVDLLYAPDEKWVFLGARLLVIPVAFIVYAVVRRSHSHLINQMMLLFYAVVAANLITFMIFWTTGISSSYYAGLNLIGFVSLAIFPSSKRGFVATAIVIYGPFLLLSSFSSASREDFRNFLVNCAFIAGTLLASLVARMIREQHRRLIVQAQLSLEQEIASREAVIQEKTEEGVKLAALSSQFSPQIVEGIQKGNIDLGEGVKRVNIGAIFIDIVGSTDRIIGLDKEKVRTVISHFIKDSVRTFLKYNITIDKFQGDGLLGFSNNPVQYDDYVDRLVLAALEIRKRIEDKQDIYEVNWLGQLNIRIGIATGYADVGFYGEEGLFRTYTAIGGVMNLASRLCTSAEPNQILISHDAFEAIKAKGAYDIDSVGKLQFKGFKDYQFRVYQVHSTTKMEAAILDQPCEVCGSYSLYLGDTLKGITTLICRKCGHIDGEAPPSQIKKVS